MYDVFVSYATPDLEVAETVVTHLESIGIRCFIATRDVKVGAWSGQLVRAIRACHSLVLAFSRHSNASPEVRKEITIAGKAQKNIIPFELEDIEVHPNLEYYLIEQQWIKAMGMPLPVRVEKLGKILIEALTLDNRPVTSPAKVPNTISIEPVTSPTAKRAKASKRPLPAQVNKSSESCTPTAISVSASSAVPTVISTAPRPVSPSNSLGMRFAPIPKLPDGKQVLGCVHPTRSKDFAAFIADKSRSYEMTGRDAEDWLKCEYQNYPVGRSDGERPEDSTHPVVCVNHADAKAFCQWLTAKERSQSLIGPEDAYRLPTDHEWSLMVGIGDQEDPTAGPATKSGKIKNRYPWGEEFPPTSKVGNYADATAKEYFGWHTIPNYEDGFAATSPVMHFPANNSGFYDLGGNVWEWCEDWFDSDQTYRVLRGACWCYVEKSALLSSYRLSELPEGRDSVIGFRCVLEMGA